MSQEQVHQWMSEIGPLLELDEVIEYPEHALWVLVFSDGQTLEAEYEAPGGRLLLSMDLGAAQADKAAALHRLLLQYNHLWRQTGGVRMALSGDNVVQMLELAVARLELPILLRALAALREQAVLWRAMLTPPADPDAADAVDPRALRV